MRIRSATASFGKLENETLRFHEGLNVIHAPNESGKSTWCAFIRAMLYGIDTSERARKGFLPDADMTLKCCPGIPAKVFFRHWPRKDPFRTSRRISAPGSLHQS